MNTYVHTCRLTSLSTVFHHCMHKCLHTCIHTNMHVYIHTYIHTGWQAQVRCFHHWRLHQLGIYRSCHQGMTLALCTYLPVLIYVCHCCMYAISVCMPLIYIYIYMHIYIYIYICFWCLMCVCHWCMRAIFKCSYAFDVCMLLMCVCHCCV